MIGASIVGALFDESIITAEELVAIPASSPSLGITTKCQISPDLIDKEDTVVESSNSGTTTPSKYHLIL